jgi:hypothetical protein
MRLDNVPSSQSLRHMLLYTSVGLASYFISSKFFPESTALKS